MTIYNLFQTIKEHAPESIKEMDLQALSSKTIAIDASNIIY